MLNRMSEYFQTERHLHHSTEISGEMNETQNFSEIHLKYRNVYFEIPEYIYRNSENKTINQIQSVFCVEVRCH